MSERLTSRTERGEGRYPFTPFPIGWFRLAYSDELAVGEAKARNGLVSLLAHSLDNAP